MTYQDTLNILMKHGWWCVKANAKEMTFAPIEKRIPVRYYRG